jgi:uncharacterized iron-regulated membrane protein
MLIHVENYMKKQAKVLRITRKIHRYTGLILFIFLFIISTTGILLGWKKHAGDLILPQTHVGVSSDFKKWLPIDSLHTIACKALHDSISPNLSLELDKIDIRKEKGMVKFVFEDHYWGVQLDGATGQVLYIHERYSDLIENIHDGSILDYYFGTTSEQIKIIYTSIMGFSIFAFAITGFWLWYVPHRIRRTKIKR